MLFCTRVAVCRVKNFLEILGLLVQFSQKKLILIKKVLQLRQNEHLFKAYFENVIIQLWWFLLQVMFLCDTDFIIRIC